MQQASRRRPGSLAAPCRWLQAGGRPPEARGRHLLRWERLP
jgi:hypothetical protein